MKFCKKSLVLFSLLASSSSAFAVVTTTLSDDEQKRYASVGQMVRHHVLQGNSYIDQQATGTWIKSKDKTGVLTAADMFVGCQAKRDHAGSLTLEAIGDSVGQTYSFVLDNKEYQVENYHISSDSPLALVLLKATPEVTPCTLASHEKDFFQNPQTVSLVGYGRWGVFNTQGLGHYSAGYGIKGLCSGLLQFQSPETWSFTGVTAQAQSFSFSGDLGTPAFDADGKLVAVASTVQITQLGFMSPEDLYATVRWPAKPMLIWFDQWLRKGTKEGEVCLKQGFFRFFVGQILRLPNGKLEKQGFAPITLAVGEWIKSILSAQQNNS